MISVSFSHILETLNFKVEGTVYTVNLIGILTKFNEILH